MTSGLDGSNLHKGNGMNNAGKRNHPNPLKSFATPPS